MEINFISRNETCIAEIIAEEIILSNTQDAVQLLADCNYNGAESIIINENNIIPGFFDLKTGIAGDILQKFSTWNTKLAIIGDFSKYKSRSLNDFIFESNKFGRINFLNSKEEALKVLQGR